MEIYIVTSKDIIYQFQKNFKEYKVDLGKSFTLSTPNKNSQSVIDIKDNFVERFIMETSKFCFKMGRMGSIHFYTLPDIDQQIWLYTQMEKMVVPCKKGTRIDFNFLGAILIEMENRLSSNNGNSFTSTINNYYQKKNSPGGPGEE